MGKVLSIESAGARRGFTAHQFAPSMDTKTSRLFRVALPITPGRPPTQVLALMVNQSATSVRLIYSDHEHSIFFRTYIGPEIPAHLLPEPLASLEAFLGRHERLCEEASLLGSANHGPLTLARAVDRCAETGCTMAEAMAYARDISLDCGQYCHRVASLARGDGERT